MYAAFVDSFVKEKQMQLSGKCFHFKEIEIKA
jgi:hypothetical protein